jgi:hypothetical protein
MTRGMDVVEPQFASPVTERPCATETAPEQPPPLPTTESQADTPTPAPTVPRWRPAKEPTCCGSGCDDCPF